MDKQITIPAAWLERLIEIKKSCGTVKLAQGNQSERLNRLFGYIESAEELLK